MTEILPPPEFPDGTRAYRFEEAEAEFMAMGENRSSWEAGPWSEEPDKVVWVDPATDYDAMILRNCMGGLCGYVGVPTGHPWFDRGYSDLPVEVHGGLNFAGRCEPGARESDHAICHTPRPGAPEVYWLGFDCGHFMDVQPGLIAFEHKMDDEIGFGGPRPWELDQVYRTIGYVRDEVTRLAQQAAEVVT